MKITREIKTAILVIASILLFIWGYSYLKGRDLFTHYQTYYVEYENVEGLAASAPVTINGLIVGKVNSIVLDQKTGKLLVELQLKTDFPITKSTTASIYEPGFIGGKQIALNPNFQDTELAIDGQKLSGNIKLGMMSSVADQLKPMQGKIEKLLENADTLIVGINNVLDEKGQADLKNGLAELSKTMAEFHKASSGVNEIIDGNKTQIKGMVSNFSKVSSDFSKISDSLQKVDVGKTVKSLNKTLATVDKIMSDLKSGKGTMGKMLNDEALYNNLEKTSKELELLLEDVRLNPTRYVNISVFGKKNKPYTAPTNDSILKN